MENLVIGHITDESIAKMRARIGYPNPTIRSGIVRLPWNTAATADGIRHYAEGYGDNNPLYVDPGYGPTTRWGSQIAPPAFDATMGFNRSPKIPEEVVAATKGALRGVQLYHSGNDVRFFRPIRPGDSLYRVSVVGDVQEKVSEFAGRSVVVTNNADSWNQRGELVTSGENWFVHAERRRVGSEHKYATEELASYTDQELADIERLYEQEYVRGSDTLYFEDIEAGTELPTMVKGPLVVTDLINFHMGAGWMGYGNPALRMGYLNRKAMPGFYTRNEFGAWDSLQRIHWEAERAREIGVISTYDIGPMRWSWLVHYCTNYVGDDGWVFRLRAEFRKFNYMGDTTWITGRIVAKEVRPDLGPCIDIEVKGTNQRGKVNIEGTATLLVASHEHGPVVLPETPTGARFQAPAIATAPSSE